MHPTEQPNILIPSLQQQLSALYHHERLYENDQVLKPGKKGLYGLSKDLGELQDISSQLPELSLELEDKLDGYIQTHYPELIKKFKKQ